MRKGFFYKLFVRDYSRYSYSQNRRVKASFWSRLKIAIGYKSASRLYVAGSKANG